MRIRRKDKNMHTASLERIRQGGSMKIEKWADRVGLLNTALCMLPKSPRWVQSLTMQIFIRTGLYAKKTQIIATMNHSKIPDETKSVRWTLTINTFERTKKRIHIPVTLLSVGDIQLGMLRKPADNNYLVHLIFKFYTMSFLNQDFRDIHEEIDL